MTKHSHIARAHDLAFEIAEQNAIIRSVVESALALLNEPAPDTFLGRKTQKPFPAEDPMQRSDVQNLLNSELQPPTP
ncbi:hypothetical protein JQ594_23880 [Bradyrhizobium manausense]|uniref:hypothetical protein n=1 Tax=Bradyrhizobium manausense TaxID=989370 RepID=UPI001BAA0E6B|nr:hypothetical protein [Bradyrhizobium manausense]MBR0688983.1 hypothetical protein [Bradyrhizobium manausense]